VTNWTTPATVAGLTVPTAAELDAQWRDNLLHLKETKDGFGFPYSPCDPRLFTGTPIMGATFDAPQYQQCLGRGHIWAIRCYIYSTAGTVSFGVYANGDDGWPATRTGTSGVISCPAVGINNVAFADAWPQMNVGDWFAHAGTNPGSSGLGGTLGPSSAAFATIPGIQYGTTDERVELNDLPETADAWYGHGGSAYFMGVNL
jgi:hypothetical protein